MRLKKIMSLVLACAMALSLVTVASAQDTEVYYIEDFSSYVGTEEVPAVGQFLAAKSAPFKAITANTVPMGGTDIGYMIAGTKAEGAANLFYAFTSNSGGITSERAEIATNSLGNKAFRPYTAERQASANVGDSIYFLTAEGWDFTDKTDETYVVSFELQSDLKAGVKGGSYQDITAFFGGDYTINDEEITWTAAPARIDVYSFDKTAANDDTFSFRTCYGYSHVNDYNNITTFNTNQAYRVAFGYKYNPANKKAGANGDYYWATRLFAIEGAYANNRGVSNVEFTNNSIEGRDKFYGFRINTHTAFGQGIANVKMYTIKSDDFKVYAENTTDVPLNTKSVRIYFSNPVAPATYVAPVVKANGVAMEEGTYSVSALKNYIGNVGGEIYSYVDVTFNGLEEGTTYTVEFPETIANEIATTLGTKNVVTFKTKSPDIKVNSFTVTNAAGLVADGSVQGAKVVLENTTSASKNVALIYAVYAGDQLADIVYINDSVAAEKTAEYEAAVELGATGILKAFIWDGMSALKPYTGARSVAISAAAAE